MLKRKRHTTVHKEKTPNLTDSGFVEVKDAPIIYAYIYDVESFDAERFKKNYEGANTKKKTVEISGFEFANNELVPKIKKEKKD